jgi:glucan phosphorylase
VVEIISSRAAFDRIVFLADYDIARSGRSSPAGHLAEQPDAPAQASGTSG